MHPVFNSKDTFYFYINLFVDNLFIFIYFARFKEYAEDSMSCPFGENIKCISDDYDDIHV